MKVAFFDTHGFEQERFQKKLNTAGVNVKFYPTPLNLQTVELATGFEAVCSFVNDHLDGPTLKRLSELGVRLIALRCAGYNNVDLKVAKQLGIKVARVPEYSPHAVAEHAVALLLTLNRKTHKAFNRVRENNFSLDGLIGFDLYQKTIGVIGTGKIGKVFCQIMRGFGCKVIAYDPFPSNDWAKANSIEYVDKAEVFKQSDVLSLHCPLNSSNHHLIDDKAFSLMKKNLILINTGRGALIDSKALIQALKSRRIQGAALDVYEEEDGVFFSDLSGRGILDDTLARLMTFPQVIITSHQAFLTEEALQNITDTTVQNICEFIAGQSLSNEVRIE